MKRYVEKKCEQYFSIHFENRFNFQGFNMAMSKERLKECIIAFDPSFIKKSKKKPADLVFTGQAAPAK